MPTTDETTICPTCSGGGCAACDGDGKVWTVDLVGCPLCGGTGYFPGDDGAACALCGEGGKIADDYAAMVWAAMQAAVESRATAALDDLIHDISNAATAGRVATELMLGGDIDRELLTVADDSFERIAEHLKAARLASAVWTGE